MKRDLRRAAFTLIELLVVIAIMAVAYSLTLPAINTTMRSLQLTQGTQIVSDQIRLARQTALTKNHSVEVRFYRYTDPEAVGAGKGKFFQAVQSFELNDDGSAKPVGKISRVPAMVMPDSSPTLSTLLDASRTKVWTTLDPQVSLPRVGTAYDACAFTFRPDGSADLSVTGQQWFITLHYAVAGDNLAALPHDFSTIQVDPWNGQVHVFRP